MAKDHHANFNIYNTMAYFVAKVLHIRPNDILDNWGTAELVVTFGHYANEKAYQQYEEWKQLDSDSRAKVKKPKEYIVYFHDVED